MKKLQLLIIHCTATQVGIEVTSDQIRKMHLSPPPVGRGWHQVGYSDMIHLNGTIENLVKHNEDEWVDPWEITNGAIGLNDVARHVVYVGGIDKIGKPMDTRTVAQKAALQLYVEDFLSHHPDCKIAAHNQFANKACPSFDVPTWCKEIGIAENNINYQIHRV